MVELEGTSVNLEKSLQTLIEQNLEPLLGVRFLASEFGALPIRNRAMPWRGGVHTDRTLALVLAPPNAASGCWKPHF